MLIKKNALLIATLLAAALSLSDAFASWQDLPNPPQGYSWKWLSSIKAGVLLPDGWFLKENEQEKNSFLISRESGDFGGILKTTLKVNVIKDLARQRGMLPSQYALRFIENVKPRSSSWGFAPVEDGLYFKGYKIFSKYQSGQFGVTVRFSLALGNNVTGTFYSFVLESPEESWESYWRVIKIVFDNLELDPEY